MSDLDRLRDEYPHLQFRENWDKKSSIMYLLGQCRAIILAISKIPLDPKRHSSLYEVSLIKGAQATTAIEGNTLSDEEISMIVKGESLSPSKEYQQKEVYNIVESMNILVKEVIDQQTTQQITPDLLRRFHRMVGKDLGENFDAIPGRFRTDARVVGQYRCPRPEHVDALIEEYCNFLARFFRYTDGDQDFADAVIEAIVAHVYLEWIHPFGDGNGRVGRLLEFYILLRAGTPDIASHIMSNYYNETRPQYYRKLEQATQERSLTNFVDYALQGFTDGLIEILKDLQTNQFETAWKSHIYSKMSGVIDKKGMKKQVFKRRRNLVLSMPIGIELDLDELTILTAELARVYAQYTERVLIRDLQELQKLQLVNKIGKKYVTNHNILMVQMARSLDRDKLDMIDL